MYGAIEKYRVTGDIQATHRVTGGHYPESPPNFEFITKFQLRFNFIGLMVSPSGRHAY